MVAHDYCKNCPLTYDFLHSSKFDAMLIKINLFHARRRPFLGLSQTATAVKSGHDKRKVKTCDCYSEASYTCQDWSHVITVLVYHNNHRKSSSKQKKKVAVVATAGGELPLSCDVAVGLVALNRSWSQVYTCQSATRQRWQCQGVAVMTSQAC